MFNQPFTPSQVRPIRPAMTVSRPAQLGQEVPVTWFSLGAGTSITPEFYDCTTLYLGGEGSGTFVLGSDAHDVPMHPASCSGCRPERCAAPAPTTALSIPKSSSKRRTLL